MEKKTIIYVKYYADWFNLSDCIFLFILFVYFRLLNFSFFSFMLCYHICWWNKVVYIIPYITFSVAVHPSMQYAAVLNLLQHLRDKNLTLTSKHPPLTDDCWMCVLITMDLWSTMIMFLMSFETEYSFHKLTDFWCTWLKTAVWFA